MADRLANWREVAGQRDDDGQLMPSLSAITVSSRLLSQFRDPEKFEGPPSRMVPDGDGGIVFEYRLEPNSIATFEIDSCGRCEFIEIENRRIVMRKQLSVSPFLSPQLETSLA